MDQPKALSKQIVANVGLYWTSYRLSLGGWNALPTSRNAKGVDLIIYNEDASKTATIQVKSLSKLVRISTRTGLPTGQDVGVGSRSHMMANYYVICTGVANAEDIPSCFILTRAEAVKALAADADGEQEWLDHKRYGVEANREAWAKIRGR